MDWIKTSDKLPEKDGKYITTIACNDGDLVMSPLDFTVEGFTDYYNNEIKPNTFYEIRDGYDYDEIWINCVPRNVIAWMSYPEPYNPEEKEL